MGETDASIRLKGLYVATLSQRWGPCMHGVSLCNTEDVSISLKLHLLRSSRWTLRPVVAVLLKTPLVLFPLSPLTFVPLQWH